MSHEQEKNRLVEKVVGKQIQKEMEMVSRTFNALVQKYSFLFDGDTLATQKMLRDAAFPTGEELVSDDKEGEKVYFDLPIIVSSIPQNKKDQIYENVLSQVAEMVSIDDLKKEEE